MPNLAGIFDPDYRAQSLQKQLDRQVASLQIPGIDYQLHEFVTDGCAIALVENGVFENGPQPSGTGRFRLFLDGEIFNGRELARQFHLSPTLSDPELCLLLFEQRGPDCFRLLNGQFAIAVFDKSAGEIWLATDRLGYRPLFYRKTGTRLIFGSELKALVAVDADRSIDEIGMLELFSFGQSVGERTWMTDHRHVPCGTCLHFHEGQLEANRYWHYRYDESAPTLGQEAYFTVYAKLMDRAVERYMKGNKRIGIFLSGGYDSRAIAAAIRSEHLPLKAFTFGDPQSRDVRFARQLAAALGLSHKTLSANEPSLGDICRAIVWRTEGFLPFIENTSIRYHGELQQEADIILVGMLGEFAGSHTWPALLAARTRPQVVDAIFARLTGINRPLVERYFQRDFVATTAPAVRESFEQGFELLDNERPLNLADSWRFSNFQFRGSFHAPSTDRHRFEIRAPHMDLDLVEFLLTIPPFARIEQRVYKKMLVHAHPELRSIPCTNSGKPINPNFLLEYPLMALRLIGRKLKDKSLSRWRREPALGREFSDLAQEVRAEGELLRQLLVPMLDDGIYPDNIFNTDAIRAAAMGEPPTDRHHIIFLSLLISWGLAAKFFLYSAATDIPDGFDLSPSRRNSRE